MNFKDVVFYKSVSINDSKVFFDEKKEIIFVWRSNVGKSSLMNAIFSKKDLVKTSSKPGKTRTANLFLVDNKYYFTDLPWYWFAKLWKQNKEALDSLISWYIEERKNYIKRVVILIDSKIWPQQSDIDMYKYLLDIDVPVLVVISKIDRLNKSSVYKSKKHSEDMFFWQDVLAISSMKWDWIPDLEKKLKWFLKD